MFDSKLFFDWKFSKIMTVRSMFRASFMFQNWKKNWSCFGEKKLEIHAIVCENFVASQSSRSHLECRLGCTDFLRIRARWGVQPCRSRMRVAKPGSSLALLARAGVRAAAARASPNRRNACQFLSRRFYRGVALFSFLSRAVFSDASER